MKNPLKKLRNGTSSKLKLLFSVRPGEEDEKINYRLGEDTFKMYLIQD